MPRFDAETVLLEGSNLIEASAGTGKTYSIALLVLRLVMQGTPINKILMVTFTNDAVAELESRIRLFLRLAEMESNGKDSGEKTIQKLVASKLEENNSVEGRNQIRKNIRDAVLQLDETSIQTIHSFCQQALNEYAFETGQSFGATVISTLDEIFLLNNSINRFWRENVTTMDKGILERLYECKFTRATLYGAIKESLKGKIFFPVRNDAEPPIMEIIAQLNPIISSFDFHEAECSRLISSLINALCYHAIDIVTNELFEAKRRYNKINFDDMILSLHKAVCEQGEKSQELINHLRSKYAAVFIDEFQDTDKLQFDIFEKLFATHAGASTILFYIGDPKQSIYSFRKADIFTYLSAAAAIGEENRYSMSTNFRSTKSVLQALNHFFLPSEDFDAFKFGAKSEQQNLDRIDYYVVDPSEDKEDSCFCKDEVPHPALIIQKGANVNEIYKNTVATIIDLLSTDTYQIKDINGLRNIKPSDLCVLIRNKNQGRKIKKMLSGHRIPCVTIDDTGILQTSSAKEILIFLEAVYDINIRSVKRALMGRLFGHTLDQLSDLNESALLEQFRAYKITWESKGVYLMLMQFIADKDIKSKLLSQGTEDGSRLLSNLLQLTELLHKMENRMNFSSVDLIHWLKIGIESGVSEGNEYEQRLESDEEAVKIVTIHKSKGLEYNIVMAPFLDLKAILKNEFISYRDPNDKMYHFVKKDTASDEQKAWCKNEIEQENRRLLYVALTRAKYACYIGRNTEKKIGVTALRVFYEALAGGSPKTKKKKSKEEMSQEANTSKIIDINGIKEIDAPEYDRSFIYKRQDQMFTADYTKASHFILDQLNWAKLSFSYLSQKHTGTPTIPSLPSGDPYDQFVFNELKKGAVTGNMLHSIFETIDYSDPTTWKPVVDQVLLRYAVGDKEDFSKKIIQFLEVVLSTDIQFPGGISYPLSAVRMEDRLAELEFDFPLGNFHTDKLNALSDLGIPVRVRGIGDLEGIMNGKIDLVFEWQGQFYILDWKSNFLGYRAEDYGPDSIETSMQENNYHLQYLIYTVALCKYLRLRKPDFDYDRDFGGGAYVFLRGVRNGKNTGFYITKPEKKLVELIQDILHGNVNA